MGKETQPLYPRLLVGAQLCLESRNRLQNLQPGRISQCVQKGVEPIPRFQSGPLPSRFRGVGHLRPALFPAAGKARKQAHAFEERNPSLGGLFLDLPPMVEGLPEFPGIHLNPAATDKRQALRRGQELLEIFWRESFAFEGHARREVEEGLGAQAGNLVVSHRYADRRAGRARALPPVGQPHHHPGLFQYRNIPQKPIRFGRVPEKGFENPTGIDELADELAFRGGLLHRGEQVEQAGFILGARKFLQGASQWQMLHPRLAGQTRRIAGHEGKGVLRAVLVLREVESHPSDQTPERVGFLNPGRRPALVAGNLRPDQRIELGP